VLVLLLPVKAFGEDNESGRGASTARSLFDTAALGEKPQCLITSKTPVGAAFAKRKHVVVQEHL